MVKRVFGKTGLELSALGFGGFHLVEITSSDAAKLLNSYLDHGGNYIETAASYGDGISEEKIGRAVGARREEYVLATKTMERTKAGCAGELDRSLKNLRTDRVDILFMHCVLTQGEADSILSPGGAMEAAMEARGAGKVRFIGVTGHGRPDGLMRAITRGSFDALMTQLNYFDRFSFPTVENELLPLCGREGVGVLAMKPLADGYLHRSLRPALRYSLSLPVASVVMGINSQEMLSRDLEEIQAFSPIAEKEKEEIFRSAPELGDYVCRLCGKCSSKNFDPQTIFLLEGLFDRQMDDMRVSDTAQYALRERLRFWYGKSDTAVKEYQALARKVNPEKDYRPLNSLCPYRIDVDRKLKIAHGKLSRPRFLA